MFPTQKKRTEEAELRRKKQEETLRLEGEETRKRYEVRLVSLGAVSIRLSSSVIF